MYEVVIYNVGVYMGMEKVFGKFGLLILFIVNIFVFYIFIVFMGFGV